MNDPVSRILTRAHPKDQVRFAKEDFDVLNDRQRSELTEPFIEKVSDGNGTAVEPLQWILRERYVHELATRLLQLSSGAPGWVFFLPFWQCISIVASLAVRRAFLLTVSLMSPKSLRIALLIVGE